MLIFPLFSDFFLAYYHRVRAFLISFVSLLLFENHRLKMRHFEIVLVGDLIGSVVMLDLGLAHVRQCSLFLISQLVAHISKTFIVLEQSVVVTHI